MPPEKCPPKSYHLEDGCHNCRWCRVVSDPETIAYYCYYGFDREPPRRDSYPSTYAGSEPYFEAVDAWERAGTREYLVGHVEGYGKCDDWQERETPKGGDHA